MKQICIFLILINLIHFLLCSGILSTTEKFYSKQPSSELGATLPETQSYWEGWVHYYRYANHTTLSRPKYFFQNNEYYSQRVPISTIKHADRHGSLIIPNKSSFFAVLTPSSLEIFATREDSMRKHIDSLNYQYIKPIPEDAYMEGGVKDLGTFVIGNCFEVKANIPSGKIAGDMSSTEKATWVFCLNKQIEKQKFMKLIIKLKLKEQRKNGVFKTEDGLKMDNKKKTLGDLLQKNKNKIPEDDKSSGAVANPTDGYWILLQNWTDCTLKCDGGKSYQQWSCIPPKNGGKPCQGQAIRERPCNTQKCPGVSTLLNMMEMTKPEIRKPIIKVGPFSSRLQRYDKCVIKETDAFLSINNPITTVDSKTPVRLVMNNQTLSIFKDDDYQDLEHSFKLKQTSFTLLSNAFCCFELEDSFRKIKICGYEKNCGDPSKNQWVHQWSKDFTLFKVGCHQGQQETLLSPDDEIELAEALKKKLGQARMSANENKNENLRQQMMLSETNNYKLSVKKTQDLGLTAIQKELQLENLIKAEEKAKEQSEINTLLKKIQEEKDKEACMQNSIKERDLDASALEEKVSAEQEVKEVKIEIAKALTIKRNKMKKLIEQMRAKANIRKASLEAELNAMRQKMAATMIKAQKSGDLEKCKDGKENLDKRDKYCSVQYPDDFMSHEDCKKEESFCYMCCEGEFGNMHLDRRETCYNMCDLPQKEVPKIEKEKSSGPWMWTPKLI